MRGASNRAHPPAFSRRLSTWPFPSVPSGMFPTFFAQICEQDPAGSAELGGRIARRIDQLVGLRRSDLLSGIAQAARVVGQDLENRLAELQAWRDVIRRRHSAALMLDCHLQRAGPPIPWLCAF